MDPEDERDRDPASDPTGTLAGVTPAPAAGSTARGRAGIPDTPPLFSAGEVLAGRFRIERFLAQGGMGEVYAAADLELGGHVALKTIRPQIAHDERAAARFRSEIQLARRVTHPNACRIFDVFHHRGGDGADSMFLTMEMLEGETLAERLRRDGRMTHAQALPIVAQVAAALEAAHQAGVIHRDFKSANVMLVPAGEAVRAVVTDFGLARAVGPEMASVTRSEDIVGTPAYMAPEQIEGGRITPATDVYALGVVLFEMLTGARPFEGETPVAALFKRLKEAPSSPRVFVPDLPREWETVVLRCLRREASDRFERPTEVVAALRGGVIPPTRREIDARRRQRQRVAAGIAAAALSLVAAWYFTRPRPGPPPPAAPSSAQPSAPSAPRRSVAVLGFRNLSRKPQSEWLSTALSEMLGSELGAGEQLRTIPGENVARMKAELALGDADSLATDTLARVRALLGSDYLVVGSFTTLGDQIRLDLRLQDAAAGETVASVTEAGTEADLFQLVSRTGARLREKLGVGGLRPEQTQTARASLPANADAARLYSEGLARLRLFDALGARERFEQALRRDPEHALTHAALAQAFTELGYDARAQESARKAFELGSALGREERLLVEARYRETTKEWPRAVEIYRSLYNFFPDNLEYGLRLAQTLEENGQGAAGLETAAALHKLAPPAGLDPRIDLTESRVARAVSDHRRAATAAARAAAAAQAQGARHLLAEARFQEGSALQNLGELDRAQDALKEAERMFAEAGDQRARAGALNNLALIDGNRGDLVRARARFEEALALYRKIGNVTGVALMQGNLGTADYYRGELAQARAMWEQTLASYREINDKQGVARMLTNLASVTAEQGDLAGGRRRFEEALAAWRDVGNKGFEAVTLSDYGRLLYDQGDLEAAVKTYERGIELSSSAGEKAYLSAMLGDYGLVLAARGDVAGARRKHADALALQQQLGQKPDAALTRVSLGELDLQEARAEAAESAARAALADAELAKSPAGPPSARLLLARALLARGLPQEAKPEAAQARALAAKMENRALRMRVEAGASAVEGLADAGGSGREALARLEKLQAEAARLGLVPVQLEARLGAARIQQRLGAPEARARLSALAGDARARGFLRVAAAAEATK
jgi:serine/threonine protein kinase/tetratricopeptide (TPR) repeat protein